MALADLKGKAKIWKSRVKSTVSNQSSLKGGLGVEYRSWSSWLFVYKSGVLRTFRTCPLKYPFKLMKLGMNPRIPKHIAAALRSNDIMPQLCPTLVQRQSSIFISPI
jgi:hypothetical protein